MKLKYYLRGLGIGMLVVALLFTVSGSTGAKMSDDAVKRRAAELGMVEKDKTVLGELGSEAVSEETVQPESGAEAGSTAEQPENNTEEPAEETKPESGVPESDKTTEAQTESAEADKNAAQQQTEPSEEDTAEQKPAQDIEERAEEVAERAEDIAENSPTGRVVTLEVHRGDSSVSVARRAEEAGLVPSAADFDVFLCRNGYDKRISVGSYEITEGASDKEIADIITKSR